MDFGNNSMGKAGASALAGLLRESPAITDVNINMNDVGDDGAFQVRLAAAPSLQAPNPGLELAQRSSSKPPTLGVA